MTNPLGRFLCTRYYSLLILLLIAQCFPSATFSSEKKKPGNYVLYSDQYLEIRAETKNGLIYRKKGSLRVAGQIIYLSKTSKIEQNKAYFMRILDILKEHTEILSKSNYIGIANYVRSEDGDNDRLLDNNKFCDAIIQDNSLGYRHPRRIDLGEYYVGSTPYYMRGIPCVPNAVGKLKGE